MSFPQLFRVSLVFFAFLAACSSSDGNRINVRVTTDLAPGIEFTRVDTMLLEGEQGGRLVRDTLDFAAQRDQAFARGVSVGEFDGAPSGTLSVRVILRRLDGAILIERTLTTTVEGDVTIQVPITRNCVGVVCPSPSGSTALNQCLDGMCVDERCIPSIPATAEFCGDFDSCEANDECEAEAECATATCELGVCIEKALVGSCDNVSWCNPDRGCEPLPTPTTDGGVAVDAEVPADAAVDMIVVVPDADVTADMNVAPDAALDAEVPADMNVAPDAGPDAAIDMGPVRVDNDGDRWFDDEDCDDNDARTYPGAYELCDSKDNDCDEAIDEDGEAATAWYVDDDGDDFGAMTSAPVFSCAAIEGRTRTFGDCNDNAAFAYPGASELCNYADDDCDGNIDDTTAACDIAASLDVDVSGTSDGVTRAWAASDVSIRVGRSGAGTLECRAGKVTGAVPGTVAGEFARCPSGAFTPTSDAGDGLYRVEVRVVYPDGLESYNAPIDYYVHASLDGATTCDYGVADETVFAKARERLPGEVGGARATFDTTAPLTTEGAARLSTPFVRINFTPRDNHRFAFGGFFGFGGDDWTATDGDFDVMSLHKQFVLSEDGTLLLVKRRYAAEGQRAAMEQSDNFGRGAEWGQARLCSVATIKTAIHDRSDATGTSCSSLGSNSYPNGGCNQSDICDYIVMNREGAGVCLQINGGVVEFVRPLITDGRTPLSRLGLLDNVDNAMWRKLSARRSPGLGITMNETERRDYVQSFWDGGQWIFGNYNGALSGIARVVGWRHFSPKCSGDASCVDATDALMLADSRYPNYFTGTTYLPDVEFFRN